MRIVIYGAGGVGSVVGGHLWRAAQDVILIGRAGHVKSINQSGLKLITPSGTDVLRMPAVTGPEQVDFGPGDVVILCMKGQNTEEALQKLQGLTKNIPIFCLQNGVRNEEIASQYFPGVYGVMVRVGAEYLTDGEVVCGHDPPGWLIIGRYPHGKDVLAEQVADKLRAGGFLTKLTEDVMPYKWGKLMANLGNAIEAITGGRGREVELIVQSAQREFIEILHQAGILWISQDEVAKEWPEINMPLRGSLETRAHSSTWQSLARQQGSVETEFLNGEVVRVAKKLGKRALINEMLVHISQEMAINREIPGKYTPGQLSSLLGLDPGVKA